MHLHHARLSISDLRPAAAQPMSEPASGLTIAFVGEIYNHLALRQTIAQPFRTDSDTETLLRVFERHGTAALPLLRGMFAIVLFDERKRRILLIRDPVGKKPLFLLQRPEGSYFGSSILALVAASGHNEIDAEVANRWWELGFSPPGMSLLAGCRPLKPGEVVELDWNGRVLRANGSCRRSLNQFAELLFKMPWMNWKLALNGSQATAQRQSKPRRIAFRRN